MKDLNKFELMIKSLDGLWVGDCIGNVGEFYYAKDILKALDEAIDKFGIDNINSMGRDFGYSDDTEEAIVLVNHLFNNGEIKQDELAIEWAKRFVERDPDGERFGYGLMTRKVLRDIYDGIPWREANLTFKRSEGPSELDNIMGNLAAGKSPKDALQSLKNIKISPKSIQRVGSCGNGAVMRITPLGSYFFNSPIEDIIKQSTLSAEPTHSHPESIAGAIVISLLTRLICLYGNSLPREEYYNHILEFTPDSDVKKGIEKSKELPLDTSLIKLIEILGNGTNVTCQDTVPLCVFLTIRALTTYTIEKMYEKVIVETCKCFGDIDTNCAIIGGMIGVISSPPEKWMKYCQPMDGLLGQSFIETNESKEFIVNKNAIADAIRVTKMKPEDDIYSLVKKKDDEISVWDW